MGLGLVQKQISTRRFMSPMPAIMTKRATVAPSVQHVAEPMVDSAEISKLTALMRDDHLEMPPTYATSNVLALFASRT
jgi:hypothetical protein